MKLHYMGKFNGNPESIPAKPHKPNSVKFKEAEDSKTLAKIINIIAIPVLLRMKSHTRRHITKKKIKSPVGINKSFPM